MSDIPEKFMTAAKACLVEAMSDHRVSDSVKLAWREATTGAMLDAIARALMAAAKEAAEAATKRERERASAVVAEIAGHYRDSSASFKAAKAINGAAISDGIARLLDDVASILKGEA